MGGGTGGMFIDERLADEESELGLFVLSGTGGVGLCTRGDLCFGDFGPDVDPLDEREEEEEELRLRESLSSDFLWELMVASCDGLRDLLLAFLTLASEGVCVVDHVLRTGDDVVDVAGEDVWEETRADWSWHCSSWTFCLRPKISILCSMAFALSTLMVSSWIFSTDKEENEDDAFWRNFVTSSSATERSFRSSAVADAEEGVEEDERDGVGSWDEFCDSMLSADEEADEDSERSFKVSSSCSAVSSSY